MPAIPDSFHGEFSSSDASGLDETNSRFALYGAGGTSALTLNASDYVIVSSIAIHDASGVGTTVYDGANNSVASGETIWFGANPNGPSTYILPTPHVCQKGTYPKVKAAASGVVKVFIHGTILRTGV